MNFHHVIAAEWSCKIRLDVEVFGGKSLSYAW